ncbi:MAG: hypothetical protein H7125_09840 [Proteobacteria bacterium]|nr:hypothetical protein [Burkholderiales bacterium]
MQAKTRTFRNRLASLLALACTAFVPAAHAAWLDLADGSYILTLTCTSSSVLNCPSLIQGSLTIDGAGASFLEATVNGELFSGDPLDTTFSSATSDFQLSTLLNSPVSFLSIRNDLSLPNSFGLPDHWWNYCENSGPGTCSPNTFGSWVVTPVQVSTVPLPSSLGLLLAGVVALGAIHRKAVR